MQEAIRLVNLKNDGAPKAFFSKHVEKAVSVVENLIPAGISPANKCWYAVKFLEHDSKVIESIYVPVSAKSQVDEIAQKLEKDT